MASKGPRSLPLGSSFSQYLLVSMSHNVQAPSQNLGRVREGEINSDPLSRKAVKNLPAMRETWAQSLGWEDPLERERLPTPVFWPGEFHGPYSPWCCKELDTTERLSLSNTHFFLLHLTHRPGLHCAMLWFLASFLLGPRKG